MVVQLKAAGVDEHKAAPGMFRAFTLIDSEVYRVGEDTDSIGKARALCAEVRGNGLFKIVDEAGVPQPLA
jgi:hypothetical protein